MQISKCHPTQKEYCLETAEAVSSSPAHTRRESRTPEEGALSRLVWFSGKGGV